MPTVRGDTVAGAIATPYQATRVTGDAEAVVSAAPAELLAVIPNDTHSGAVAIRNAAAAAGGSTPLLNAAGAVAPGAPISFGTGITVDGGASCDVTVLWRAA